MVSKGQFVGLDWNRITRLHSQVMIGTQEVKNSLTASRCHLKAYQRCGQPTYYIYLYLFIYSLWVVFYFIVVTKILKYTPISIKVAPVNHVS